MLGPVDILVMAETYSVIYGKYSHPDLQRMLNHQPDFKNEKSRLETMVERRGHIAKFLPKFHCELNFTELIWCKCKTRTRKRRDRTWWGLKESMWNVFGMPDSLDVEGGGDHQYEEDKEEYDDVDCITSLFLQRAARKVRHFFQLHKDFDGKEFGLYEKRKTIDTHLVKQAQNLRKPRRRDPHLAPVLNPQRK